MADSLMRAMERRVTAMEVRKKALPAARKVSWLIERAENRSARERAAAGFSDGIFGSSRT